MLFQSILSLFLVITGVTCKIKSLDESNWDLILKGEWMLEFYAPWCPACKALETTWKELSEYGDEFGISVGQVDVTVSPGLSGRFMVTALPTIFHVSNGEFRQYRGSRDIDSFLTFVKDKKWKDLQSVPSWKSPASYQMTAVAYFFKLSQLLRNTHARLMEDYGLPTWGSYLIFAIATIIFGALLGLIIVFCIDFFYPPKINYNAEGSPTRRKDDAEEHDLEDEIVDEQSEENASPPVRKRRSARKAD